MQINDFLILDAQGDQTPADPQGSHVAFSCMVCQWPILASTLEGQPGSDETLPAVCRECGAEYFLDVRWHAEKLYIFPVELD